MIEWLIGGDGNVFGAEFVTEGTYDLFVLAKLREVSLLGGPRVDEEILLRLGIMKEKGILEIEIYFSRIKDTKSCSPRTPLRLSRRASLLKA